MEKISKVTALIPTGLQYSAIHVECDSIETAMELHKKYDNCLKLNKHNTPKQWSDGDTYTCIQTGTQWKVIDGQWKILTQTT